MALPVKQKQVLPCASLRQQPGLLTSAHPGSTGLPFSPCIHLPAPNQVNTSNSFLKVASWFLHFYSIATTTHKPPRAPRWVTRAHVFGDERLAPLFVAGQARLQEEVWHHPSGHCCTFPPAGTLLLTLRRKQRKWKWTDRSDPTVVRNDSWTQDFSCKGEKTPHKKTTNSYQSQTLKLWKCRKVVSQGFVVLSLKMKCWNIAAINNGIH